MYNGGKNADGVYQTIINQFPPHTTYIELFGGSGAIIKNKRPAKENYLLEIDRDVVKGFHTGCFKLHNYDTINVNALNFVLNYQHCKLYDDPFKTLIYADPPYLMSSRRSQKPLYKYEWTKEMHEQFLGWAVKSMSMLVISAYRNELYDTILSRWRRVDYNAGIRTGEKVVESLYINYPVPDKLHEYTYLGKNFRERERIQRMIRNRTAGLLRLPVYYQEAILESLLQARKK
jgi:DNA adenine methylase